MMCAALTSHGIKEDGCLPSHLSGSSGLDVRPIALLDSVGGSDDSPIPRTMRGEHLVRLPIDQTHPWCP